MKAKTIEQYKILEYIKEHFYIEKIKMELIDNTTVKVTDQEGATLNFYYKDNRVEWS